MILNMLRNAWKYFGDRNNLELWGQHGVKFKLITKDIDHTLGTGSLGSTMTAAIPDGAIVIGYGLRILETIVAGDRTTISIGHASTQAQYGTKAALVAGTTIGFADGSTLTSAPLYAADQDLVITISGGATGNITAGKVRVSLAYFMTTAPVQ